MLYTILGPTYAQKGETGAKYPAQGENGIYSDGTVEVRVQTVPVRDGLEKISHTWINVGSAAIEIQPEIRVQADFPYARYLIPGISVNGNDWGKGGEPKGLALDGEPWVFDYRRTTLPSCTISENARHFLALMASDEDEESLVSSCSMIDEGGRMIHRLLYPCIERPLTYSYRDSYSPAYDTWIALAPEESFCASAWILSGTPAAENFAAANVQDAALGLLGKPYAPAYTVDEICELAVSHAKNLLCTEDGKSLFTIGKLPDKDGFRMRRGYEFGWCGQNGMYSRLFIQKGLRDGDKELVDIGIANLDAWVENGVRKTGLMCVQYDQLLDGRPVLSDTCNLGYVLMELAHAYEILNNAGIQRPGYLDAACKTADFLIAHYSEEHGFGKLWNADTGESIDPTGTIGAFIVPGLIDLWKVTKKAEYLAYAKTALRYYCRRDMSRFVCTAGALDTYCIDKETSGPILMGALRLYEIEPYEEWLDWAQKAGWYFCSWMMHHDTVNAPESDFAFYGYHTLGGTSVSAQHHHLDPWGAMVVPEMLKLYEITGDKNWKKRACLMWANAIQGIAPEGGATVHGRHRHAGAQNEAYMHCRWGQPEQGPASMNDWLVAWPQAFCMNTAMQLSDDELRICE
ncbi:MAG: hypothetical protein IJC54_08585 [Clostridia bacterium]|nr:hypothetical protein [Clostridia bacterium]